MRVKIPGFPSGKAPKEGSVAPILALMVLAAVAAAVTLWLRSEDAPSGKEGASGLSPTSGMPAVPHPHTKASSGAGV